MLIENMQACGIKKIDMPRALISLRNNAESVSIANEKELVEWLKANNDELLNYKEPEISKTRVKAVLQDGREIPGAELIRTTSLIIR